MLLQEWQLFNCNNVQQFVAWAELKGIDLQRFAHSTAVLVVFLVLACGCVSWAKNLRKKLSARQAGQRRHEQVMIQTESPPKHT